MDAEHTDSQGAREADEDTTLGGYFSVHDRPPAFEGCDGQPYTVSIETERTPDLKAPVSAYLVFPKWAETGLGVIGHVESLVLWKGPTREAVLAQAGETPLQGVQQILNEAIIRRLESPGKEGTEHSA